MSLRGPPWLIIFNFWKKYKCLTWLFKNMLAGILGLGPGTREPSEVVVARQADIWILKLHRKILQNHIKHIKQNASSSQHKFYPSFKVVWIEPLFYRHDPPSIPIGGGKHNKASVIEQIPMVKYTISIFAQILGSLRWKKRPSTGKVKYWSATF